MSSGRRSVEHLLTARFSDGLVYAANLHRTQVRKGGTVPYLAHLLAVSSLVLEDGGDEDEAIAGLLHDAVEDQGGKQTLEAIRARFGDRVAGIVAECTDHDPDLPRPPWAERKEQVIASLRHKSPSGVRVSLADKLHNARSILRDYEQRGEDLWSRFNRGRDDQLWYFRGLADTFAALSPSPMADELSRVVADLEEAVRTNDARPSCPACDHHPALPLLFGMPSAALGGEARRGRVVLGGCVVLGDEPRRSWACPVCHTRW